MRNGAAETRWPACRVAVRNGNMRRTRALLMAQDVRLSRSFRGRPMDTCYYALVRKAQDGRFVAWVPDLPGVTAAGPSEDEVVRELSRSARELLRVMLIKGLPPPATSPVDKLPLGDHAGRYRRLLLILT